MGSVFILLQKSLSWKGQSESHSALCLSGFRAWGPRGGMRWGGVGGQCIRLKTGEMDAQQYCQAPDFHPDHIVSCVVNSEPPVWGSWWTGQSHESPVIQPFCFQEVMSELDRDVYGKLKVSVAEVKFGPRNLTTWVYVPASSLTVFLTYASPLWVLVSLICKMVSEK